MLDLDDDRWATLAQAYGGGHFVSDWLRRVAVDPEDQDAWNWLRAGLCHQFGVYDAAYAAVRHLVSLAGRRPPIQRRPYIELAAWVEGCRQVEQNFVAEVPPDLSDSYFTALRGLPRLIAECSEIDWDQETTQVYAGALAIVKGHGHLGMTINSMSTHIRCPECGEEFDYQPY